MYFTIIDKRDVYITLFALGIHIENQLNEKLLVLLYASLSIPRVGEVSLI